MNQINIKEAKVILINLLKTIETARNKEEAKENFKLVLRFLYINPNLNLQNESAKWIKIIENYDELTQFVQTENDEQNRKFFYTGYNANYRTQYHYYINKLGIVLLVSGNLKDTFELYDYKKQKENKECWLIPIENGLFLGGNANVEPKEKSFFYYNSKSDFREGLNIGEYAVFNLLKTSNILQPGFADNYNWHHIVNNKPNDAIDNRIDNIIIIPKDLHTHAELNKSDYEKAQELFYKVRQLL